MGRVVLLLALGAVGCTFGSGIRVGGGVARSTKPVTLTSPIGEGSAMADASNSQEWAELEVLGDLKYVRGIFMLGGGNSHTRFRESPMGNIFAKDDNFHARAGGGFGLLSPEIEGFRLVPYFVYNSNFGVTDNDTAVTKEYGVDVEWSTVMSKEKKVTSSFVMGAALITETGPAYADLHGFGSHEGTFEVKGVMITFAWHLAVALGGDDD
jgi:hypothetical protein